MHDSQRCKFDFQGGGGMGWSVVESESGRLCNWILLHGDKKNTVIQGKTLQRTLKFSHPHTQARSSLEIFLCYYDS